MICGAWVVATGVAITLSWFGVETVLKGTGYDPPRAVPLPADPAAPDASSTHRPPGGDPSADPGESPGPPDGGADGDGEGTADGTAGEPDGAGGTDGDPSAAGSPGTAPATREATGRAAGPGGAAEGLGSVETVRTDGGRVAFDLGGSSAELVSATPEPGWEMQVWDEPGWIRVVFTGNGREVSVFCLWHDGPPRIERYER